MARWYPHDAWYAQDGAKRVKKGAYRPRRRVKRFVPKRLNVGGYRKPERAERYY